jgi:hypothetical protein
MERAGRLMLLLHLIALIVITGIARALPSQAPPLAVPSPPVMVGVILAVGCAASGMNAVFIKRHTAAAGFG